MRTIFPSLELCSGRSGNEDDISLVGGITLEDPSVVVPVSACWSGYGWVGGGAWVVVAGRCS
jgi:hypothetical protein